MMTASPSFEQGRVYLPKDAPWLTEFENELLLFPQAPFDDQVDSVTQYLLWERGSGRVKFEYEFI
jgi:predicted phage terminase large subunit-like protein